MAGEIVIPESNMGGLAIQRDPEVVLAEAQKAAKALQKVLAGKRKPVMMNGEQYLEFEDWQTVARFYGLTAKVDWTKPIEIGGAVGFESRAVVIDVRSGMEISAAEAMCLNDEDKWSKRTKYEWKTIDGQRVKEPVGEESVPLFQLRSMSQTRACSKALRNTLAWVVVLAGFQPTPAEDLDQSKPPEEDQDLKLMKARFDSKCAVCAGEIKKGDDIVYNGKTKKACHPKCLKETEQPKQEPK